MGGTLPSTGMWQGEVFAISDCLVLYGSEVWGGFGIKGSASANTEALLVQCLKSDKTDYEKLNNKMAKFALRMPSRCSNIGCRGELGRYPLSVSILTSVLKYYSRLINCQKNTLLHEALTSQHLTTFNSRKTMTYIDFTKRVLDYGNLDVSGITSKYQRNEFGRKTKQFLEKKYKCVFFDILQNSSKLELYSDLKSSFRYEQYLQQVNFSALTKIRLSCHWFPIERGRYGNFTVRENRVCHLCTCGDRSGPVGDEVHCILQCPNSDIQKYKNKYISMMCLMSHQLEVLTGNDKILLLYILKGHDVILLPNIIEWLDLCNIKYKGSHP